MPPPQALENRLLTSLEAVLTGIGAPANDWLTDPVVVIGIPGEAVERSAQPQLYLHHISTIPTPNDATIGMRTHEWRVRFGVWILASSFETVRNAKADIARAVMLAEDSFTASFGQPAWCDEFVPREQLTASGVAAGLLTLVLDAVVNHATA